MLSLIFQSPDCERMIRRLERTTAMKTPLSPTRSEMVFHFQPLSSALVSFAPFRARRALGCAARGGGAALLATGEFLLPRWGNRRGVRSHGEEGRGGSGSSWMTLDTELPVPRIASSRSRKASNIRSFSATGRAANSRRKARLLSSIFCRSKLMAHPREIGAETSAMSPLIRVG